jgi:hypothetical protein
MAEPFFSGSTNPVGRFFDQVLTEVNRLPLNPGTENQRLLNARDEWIYSRICAGDSKKTIRDTMRPAFSALTKGQLSDSAIRTAAIRHAKKRGLPTPPPGRGGRPKKKRPRSPS